MRNCRRMDEMHLEHLYSGNITNQRILILGPTPPPLGGVSVHVDRVAHKLKEQGNTVHTFVPTQELRYRFLPLYLVQLFFQLCWYRPTYVYYHTSYLLNSLREMELLVACTQWFSYKLIFVEHDCRHLGNRGSAFVQAFKKIFKKLDYAVLIGTSTHEHYRTQGMLDGVNYSVESAFLPPDKAHESLVLATYSDSLHAFLAEHQPLLVANAFQLSFLQDKDLYGFDACIELINDLKSHYPDVGMVFALATIGNPDYFIRLQTRIAAYKLQQHVYFLMDQKELWPLLKRATVLIRPTLSDGASVSVEEAVYLGTPVVASNVCWRPAGVETYRVGDQQDLYTKVTKVLYEHAQYHNQFGYYSNQKQAE